MMPLEWLAKAFGMALLVCAILAVIFLLICAALTGKD